MAKKDYLAGVTNEIPMKKDPFCDGMQDMFEEGMDNLEDLVKDGKNRMKKLQRMVPNIESPFDLDGKLDAMSKLRDMIKNGMKIGLGECDSLLDCLGTNVADMFGFDPDKLLRDPKVDFSKYPKTIADQLNKFVDSTLSKILNKGEKALLDALKEMEDQVDISALDDLLALAGCFAGHCDRPDKIPPELDIEKKMEEGGYQIDGDVDLGQTGLDKAGREHFSKIKSSRRELDSVVNKSLSKVF